MLFYVQSQEILNSVVKRDLYKYIGHTKISYKITMTEVRLLCATL